MQQHEYYRVIGIDVGYRNLSWCVIDNINYAKPYYWQVEDLWVGRSGKPTREQLYVQLKLWCARNWKQLKMATKIIVEGQMRKLFIAMEAFLVGRYPYKTITAHPRTVGNFWRLPGKREPKKAAAIRLTRDICKTFPVTEHKLDDLADSYLMALRHLVLFGGVPLHSFSL